MKYIFLPLCAALRLIETFQTQTCTRNSDFHIRLDDHYDDTILSAEIESPTFLKVSSRSISKQNLASLHSTFPISIKDLGYLSDTPVVLDSQSLVFFNMTTYWNNSMIQHYMHPVIQNYSNLVTGRYILLYNSHSFALFTNDRVYPRFITEFYPQGNISCIVLCYSSIVVALNDCIQVLEVEDVELGALVVTDVLMPGKVNLTEFCVRDMWTDDYFVYVLDENLGLARFFVGPLEVDKVFDIYGEKIAGFEDSVVIDGKFLLNTESFQIFSYGFDRKCEYLALDLNFIYCAAGDEVLFVSRLLDLNKTMAVKTIKGMIAENFVMMIAFKDSVSVDEVDLSALYVTGKAPSEVSDYEVKFQVFGQGGEGDKQNFTLKVLYTLTDVILFIVFCLSIVFLIVGGAVIAYRCLGKKERQSVIPSALPQDSMNPETIRNPFSERRLVDRTQSLN